MRVVHWFGKGVLQQQQQLGVRGVAVKRNYTDSSTPSHARTRTTRGLRAACELSQHKVRILRRRISALTFFATLFSL